MHTKNCTHTITTLGLPPSVRSPSLTRQLLALVLGWSARSRQRRDLAKLSDAALRDIGLSRQDVHLEISKPFWQL